MDRRGSRVVQVECAICHKIEIVPLSRAISYKTCSRECMGKYNSQRYSQRLKLNCPICGNEYECKRSAISHHRTCGKSFCRSKWYSQIRSGSNNSRYVEVESELKNKCVRKLGTHDSSRTMYQHVVKSILCLPSVKAIPKGYVIHHKDANHSNNDPQNLVVLPKSVHRLIHTWFGNVVINALHTGRITRDEFYKVCDKDAKQFYSQIIDLDITHQVVVKQGELLESPEVGNQQPSIYRNIIEGSTTNSRVLAGEAEDGNADTSALPISDNGDDIV